MIIDVVHFKEANKKLVRVPLANSKWQAVLYETDFKDLVDLGISPKWRLYHKQVVVRNNGKNIAIARLIRRAGVKQVVISIDSDPCNLRKENLVLSSGNARYDARNIIVRPFKPQHILENIKLAP